MNCAGEERVKSHLTKAKIPLFYADKFSNVNIFLIVLVEIMGLAANTTVCSTLDRQ